MSTVRLARMAMASRFELVLHGGDPAWLRAAGEEALDEISRLERQLSFYSASSDISRINRQAYDADVRVEPRLFELLHYARRVHLETGGAFDVTLGPLMRCWGFTGATGRVPDPEALELARSMCGMDLVVLDEDRRSVRFAKRGVEIDLGGIGKGFAIDEAFRILREAGITDAFLHGGTSTMMAMGLAPDGDTWNVGIAAPVETAGDSDDSGEEPLLAVSTLSDEALAVSDVRGKWFEEDGRVYGHVLDPRSGFPAAAMSAPLFEHREHLSPDSDRIALTAVVAASATEADALSTTLLVLGLGGIDKGRLGRGGDLRVLIATAGSDRIARVVFSDFGGGRTGVLREHTISDPPDASR